MEDRKGRFDDRSEVRGKIAEVLKKLAAGGDLFDGVHVFTPNPDVPDDASLRLVFLPPEKAYNKQEQKTAFDEVLETVRSNGSKPRYRGNRLVFIAPDQSSLMRLRDCVRTALAWASIVDDIKTGRLNIDRLQEDQAKKELETAEGVVPRAARECFKWLLCPVMAVATDRQANVEAFPLNTSGGSYSAEVQRVCQENELVISAWSPVHLRNKLRELYWKEATVAVRAAAVWDDLEKYLYLPRLKHRAVLEQAIQKGTATHDFFGTAYGQTGDVFDGFKLGDPNVKFDDTLLLIEPGAAAAYAAALDKKVEPPSGQEHLVTAKSDARTAATAAGLTPSDAQKTPQKPGSVPTPRAKAFFGSVDVNATTAKMKLVSIAEEIIAVLASDPNATVKVTLEISADFPNGATEQTKRAVAENASALGFKSKLWE
jgi:hypothetical protein